MDKITVPFKKVRVYDKVSIQVELYMNGKKMYAIVDTGAERTFFNERVLKRLGVLEGIEFSKGTYYGIDGKSLPAKVFDCNDFSIGGYSFKKSRCLLIPEFGFLSHFSGTRIGVLLGGDILNRYKAIIDYGKKQLTITPNKKWEIRKTIFGKIIS